MSAPTRYHWNRCVTAAVVHTSPQAPKAQTPKAQNVTPVAVSKPEPAEDDAMPALVDEVRDEFFLGFVSIYCFRLTC